MKKLSNSYVEIKPALARHINILFIINKLSWDMLPNSNHILDPVIYDEIEHKSFIHKKYLKDVSNTGLLKHLDHDLLPSHLERYTK